VHWVFPASNGGRAITQYKVTATDLTNARRGGQTLVNSDGGDTEEFQAGLTARDRYTFTVTATNSVGTGPASAPSNVVAPAILGIGCGNVIGSTHGVVTLETCKSGGKLAGPGTLSGITFVGKRTGTISWTPGGHHYSTTIKVSTSMVPARQSCGGTHTWKAYDVKGTVSANTDPDLAVGYSVNGYLCINPAGAVKQSHYGSISF
jgi:hypothetical protein